MGKKKRPFYRLVVLDSRKRRDGAYLANLGYYNPFVEPFEVRLHEAEILSWLGRGASVSGTAKALLKSQGILYHFSLLRQGLPAEKIDELMASWREQANVRSAREIARREEAEKAAAAARAEAEAKRAEETADTGEAGEGAKDGTASADTNEATATEAPTTEPPAGDETEATNAEPAAEAGGESAAGSGAEDSDTKQSGEGATTAGES
jgi:small subunit ribosomal protein S16